MSRTRPGKLMVDPKKFVPIIKENIHRTLDNYYGITISHWRNITNDRNVYYDRVSADDERQIQDGIIQSEWQFVGLHLLHLSPQDWDDLNNRSVHVEELLPIECILDPTQTWIKSDEIGITLNLEDTTLVKWFEISRIRDNSHAGITLFKYGDIVPVRSSRVSREFDPRL